MPGGFGLVFGGDAALVAVALAAPLILRDAA
jgi:hypothetical protein